MGIQFDDNKPIYQQLMIRLSSEIIRGDRQAGAKLPSVREYAIEVGVNANTIQRVYRELENQQVVESKRGQGTFVTEDNKRLEDLREDMKREFVRQFMKDMHEMGFSLNEMIRGIEVEGQGEK